MDAQRLLGRVACRATTTTAAAATTTMTTAAVATAARCSTLFTHNTTAGAAAAASAAGPAARRRLWTASRPSLSTFPSSSSSSPSSPSSSSSSVLLVAPRPSDRRYQSTANRTKRALNIAPHPAFLPGSSSSSSGAAAAKKSGSKLGGDSPATPLGVISGTTSSPTGSPTGSTSPSTLLLYNPPASAPSVYQTPFKFLPKTDPRRRTQLTQMIQAAAAQPSSSSSSSSSSAAAAGSPALAPELPHRKFAPAPQKYHLTQEDVAELRRLRALDPLEWSVLRLAKHFQCSPIFVMLAVRSSEEHRQRREEEVAAVRSRWGPIRTKAREDRRKRREMLYNGEL